MTTTLSTTPTVTFDPEAGAAYVRFKRGTVARSLPQDVDSHIVVADYDENGSLLGLEIVGLTHETAKRLLSNVYSGETIDAQSFLTSREI